MLWPDWVSLRLGPLLKGGADYRTFLGKIYLLRNFQPCAGYVTGFKKARVLYSCAPIAETDWQTSEVRGAPLVRDRNKVVVFRGDSRHFLDLQGAHREILAALRDMTQPDILHEVDHLALPPIALNIRRARDFKEARSPADFVSKGGLRTPLDWFAACLQSIRRRAGYPVGAFVISDGEDQDLGPVLGLPEVRRIRTSTAIADLLLLSRARVILGSGGSSFSAWGAFLSQAAIFTIPGQSMTWFSLEQASRGPVGVFDPDSPDAAALEQICAALIG